MFEEVDRTNLVFFVGERCWIWWRRESLGMETFGVVEWMENLERGRGCCATISSGNCCRSSALRSPSSRLGCKQSLAEGASLLSLTFLSSFLLKLLAAGGGAKGPRYG